MRLDHALFGDDRGVRALLPLALPVLIAFAAGCGGGAETLTADEYRKQADAICAKANKKIEALGEPDSIDEFRNLVEDARPTVEDAVEDLGELDPPEDLEKAHDRWMDQNERLLETFEKLETVEDEQELARLGEQFAEENEAANRTAREDLDLDTCAED